MTEPVQSVEDFYAQYEDLAIAVVSDQRPNIQIGLDLTNEDMCDIVMDILEWEEFSLFDDYDFEKIYNQGAAKQILAYCYIAYLRWELWLAAAQQKVGDEDFNEKACAHSELWYLRLRDKYEGLISGEVTDHIWMN